MHDIASKERMGIVVTIVDHGNGNRVAQLYKKDQSNMVFQYTCRASGTASSELLDYLGLAETEKDVVISLLACSRIPRLLERVSEGMQLAMPGKGIAFTLRLTALSSYVFQHIGVKDENEEGTEYVMEREAKYELILAVVNHGFADRAMNAAKTEGATGGTVIEARLLGTEEASRFLGITIKEEKEIVAIVAHKESKAAIMQAINREAGVRTDGKGILMALPVDNLIGLGERNTL